MSQLLPVGATLATVSNTVYMPVNFNPYASIDQVRLELVATGFSSRSVNDIANAGDNRLFAAEAEGKIRIIDAAGNLLPQPFLDLGVGGLNVIRSDHWEEGLLGLVFHPSYAVNGFFYVTYTDAVAGSQLVVERYTRSVSDPNAADPTSGQRLLIVPKPSIVHSAGDLNFGPDGLLYIALGDGGPDPVPPSEPIENRVPGDQFNNGQSTNQLLGSIIRLDVDQLSAHAPDCGLGANYTIPASNPYSDGVGGDCDELWVIGLRNPWRFSFDAKTGDMYIGDVGEWLREEVDFVPANSGGGQNFGWHCREGTVDYTQTWPEIAGDCDNGQIFHEPFFEFDTHFQAECSVTGGFVYRGALMGALDGWYLFADFCTGSLFRSRLEGVSWVTLPLPQSPGSEVGLLSTFGEGADGELYVGTYGTASVYKIVAD